MNLRRMIAADPHGEFGFHLTVTAQWFAGSLRHPDLRGEELG